MRWPWQRQTSPDLMQAQAALIEAEQKLTAQRREQQEFDRVAADLEERRHRNRFAEMLDDALTRRRQA